MTTAPDTPPHDDAHGDEIVTQEEAKSPAIDPRTTRRVMLISGGLALLFGVYVLAFLIPDTIKSLSGPEYVAIAQAGDSASSSAIYAEIEGGVWHCDTIEYIKGWSSSSTTAGRRTIVTKNTEIFLTDAENLPNVVMLVTESGEKSCEDFQKTTLDGHLKRMSSGTQQELANEVRLAQFPGATTYLEMCSYCGPTNSAIGVGFGVVAVIGGGFLLSRGRRIRVVQDEDAEQDAA